ncbi:hypothetical protein M426DRAFT_14438 [Hypoxylon sp. CI-4A]|nr:hypothetical protein M426DRAFT_14438 [Hypoxylon sp. CI-4A]
MPKTISITAALALCSISSAAPAWKSFERQTVAASVPLLTVLGTGVQNNPAANAAGTGAAVFSAQTIAGTAVATSYLTVDVVETATVVIAQTVPAPSSYHSSLTYVHPQPIVSTQAVDSTSTWITPNATSSISSSSSASSSTVTIAVAETSTSTNTITSTNTWSTTTSTSTSTTSTSTESPVAATDEDIVLAQAEASSNILKDDSDYVFDINKARKDAPGTSGDIIQIDRRAFPALTGAGVGLKVGFLRPCAVNTPHINNNNAGELLVVTNGHVVSETVIKTSGQEDRHIVNHIEEFQATPYYAGAQHTQYNPTCADVSFITPVATDALAKEIPRSFLALGSGTIKATAGNHFDGADIDKLRQYLSAHIADGVEQCLKACNIPKNK